MLNLIATDMLCCLLQEEEIQRAAEERQKKEEEEAAKWMDMIKVEQEGTGERGRVDDGALYEWR